eukprot:4003934-Pleurochrysis_carterae.AAC.3
MFPVHVRHACAGSKARLHAPPPRPSAAPTSPRGSQPQRRWMRLLRRGGSVRERQSSANRECDDR